MAKTDFISQMVEETMGAYDTSEKLDISLSPASNSLDIELEYSSYRKCYIYRGDTQDLEIPRNWGPFANRISKEFTVSKMDDNYHFLEILAIFLGQEVQSVKFTIVSESFGSQKQAA